MRLLGGAVPRSEGCERFTDLTTYDIQGLRALVKLNLTRSVALYETRPRQLRLSAGQQVLTNNKPSRYGKRLSTAICPQWDL